MQIPAITCGIIGSGTCRLSAARGTASGYLKVDSQLLLVDCGATVPQQVAALRLLEGCTQLDIHISHAHSDHFIGLFPLLHALTWSDDARDLSISTVRIHCTREVELLLKDLYERIGPESLNLNASLPVKNRVLQFCSGPDEQDWQYDFAGISVLSAHLPTVNNHGLRFAIDGIEIGFTCDATYVSSELKEFVRGLDIAVFDFGHLCNIEIAPGEWEYSAGAVIELMNDTQPKLLVATHGYLRDLQHLSLSEAQRETMLQSRVEALQAEATEFGGQLILGSDGQVLYRNSLLSK